MLATLPEDARDLVDTLLCAEKTEASKTYLLRHMRKFIKSKEVDENYVERTKSIKADGELAERLLSAGEAWDVSLDITADRISITYMPNEACLSGRELVRKKGDGGSPKPTMPAIRINLYDVVLPHPRR